MSPRRVPPACTSPASVLVLATLLALATPGQAAEQPEAPGEFRNGQDKPFGSVAMAPYLSAGEGSLPIEARFVLRDLETLGTAADVLFAFNVKGDAVRATIETLRTADGRVLVPLRTGTVDQGRQPQAHFAPADLLAVASEGRIDLVLAGRVEAKADTLAHVGAMAIAFDAAWGTLPSGDGSAQLYGFTMVSVVGLGAGVMPFQGQGNTWAMLPLALLAFVAALAGAMAVSFLVRMPARAPVPASVPVFGGPASPILASKSARATSRPVQASRPQPPPGSVVPAPLQGPLLPPHPLDRSPTLGAPGAAPAPPPVAEATATLPAQPARSPPPRRSAQRPAARPAGRAVQTATRRPKARPAGKAAAPRSGETGGRVSQVGR